MNEFLEIGANLEQPSGGTTEQLNDAVRQIGREANLGANELSWIEKMFENIGDTVADILDINDGYDTERIAPRDTAGENMDPVVEYNLDEATQEWHVQEAQNSCAVCAQQFIINEFLDQNVTEAELEQIAWENGWYDPEGGTSPHDADNLLQYFGIDTQINEQGTIADIVETLDQGGRVIVGVDSNVLWTEGFGNYPLSGADHAVEIIGIDRTDPNDVKVIMNDSGTPDGCGKAVPLDEFVESWGFSGGFMISAMPKD